MPGQYDVYIIDVEGRFMVRPAVAAAAPNGPFKIRNLTDFPATVNPDAALNTRSLHIAPGGWGQFQVSPRSDGLYQYEVWLRIGETDLRVNGESDPVIIIDP